VVVFTPPGTVEGITAGILEVSEIKWYPENGLMELRFPEEVSGIDAGWFEVSDLEGYVATELEEVKAPSPVDGNDTGVPEPAERDSYIMVEPVVLEFQPRPVSGIIVTV
jgi:hypothetical protein